MPQNKTCKPFEFSVIMLHHNYICFPEMLNTILMPIVVVVVLEIQPEKAQTPKAWERPATLASDTQRPLYGQKTPKKLVGFNVSFQTVHWTRIGHASVTVGVFFYLVERSRSAWRKEPRRACSEQTNRNKPL